MGVDYQKGMILFDQGRYREAAERFQEEALDDRSGRSARSMLALCLLNAGDKKRSRQIIEDALEKEPQHAHAHYVMAHVWLRETVHKRRSFRLRSTERSAKRMIIRAQESLDEAIRLEPFNPGYHSLSAILHGCRADWAASLAAAEAGLQFSPNHTGCANQRAIALKNLGLIHESDGELLRALSLEPENELTHCNRGWLALQQRQPKAAAAHFVAALQKNPSMKQAQRGLKFSGYARIPGVGWLIALCLSAGAARGSTLVIIAYFSVEWTITWNRTELHLPQLLFIPFVVLMAFAAPITLLLIVKYGSKFGQWRQRRRARKLIAAKTGRPADISARG